MNEGGCVVAKARAVMILTILHVDCGGDGTCIVHSFIPFAFVDFL